jgi:hypothetical protein
MEQNDCRSDNNFLSSYYSSHPNSKKTLNGSDTISLLAPSLINEFDGKLRTSLVNKQNASMVVVGNNYESKRYIEHTIAQIQRKEGLSAQDILQNTIYLDGALLDDDHDAFTSLSNQCLLRSNLHSRGTRDRNLSSILEDIEAYFHQCRLNEIPSIILIENFHVFAKSKRQMFIYTLFDYVHRSDLLFMVIGLTPQIDLFLKLEKRILSRLNSQFYYLKKLNAINLCQYFIYNLLLFSSALSSSSSSKSPEEPTKEEINAERFIDSTEGEEESIENNKEAFRKQFNKELLNTFGSFIFTYKDEVRSIHTLFPKEDYSSYSFSLSKEGNCFPLIEMMVDWGRDLQ